jgi:hypothetical protein
MRVPGAAEMLNIWERSGGKTSIERSMDLLSRSSIGEDPAALSIGQRDVHLFRLRERFFGARLSNIADCPSCRERVEWVGSIGDLLVTGREKEGPVAEAFMFHAAPYVIRFRLPNSYDLLNAYGYKGKPERLLFDCILEVRKDEERCNAADLPAEVFDQLDQRMAEEDPQADVSMLLSCPKCSHHWEMSFDICSYLWIEIDHWAKHILREVAVLASAFGWSESEILNMSPRRRRLYLEMIRQ